MSLPDEVRSKYIAIIDDILADADLTTISAKAVRKGIQAKVEFDITPHKNAINDLIVTRFDVAEAKQKSRANGAEQPVPSIEGRDASAASRESTITNGVHKSSEESAADSRSFESSPAKREGEDDDLSEVAHGAPPKKRRKPDAEDDAAIAARLQAEEDRLARPTRGGTSRKAAPTKKKKKTPRKSKNRLGSEEDSDLGGEDKPKKPKSNTGFNASQTHLLPLSALLGGAAQLSRPEVTKQLWNHIKAHDLQDPSDKRYILCDNAMREVFKTDRVHMFQMTKIANQHMYNPEE
ncbi:hypothetical protein DV738_g2631, partial [Chaetothyriales sp. CBS 135597]